MIRTNELAEYLDGLLSADRFADYAPNGLQVEGRAEIRRLVTGVSASQALLDRAVALRADAILVHHGFFWKNEPRTLTGLRAKRVGTLLRNDISLLGYHLPLDAHEEFGNNTGVLRAIGCTPTGTFSAGQAVDGWFGELPAAIPMHALVERIAKACDRAPLVFAHGPDAVRKVGVCTGGGASFFEAAIAAGADVFISGEPAEMSAGLAHELGANFVAAGHHATERFGPQQLGEHLRERFDLHVEFVDIDNPV